MPDTITNPIAMNSALERVAENIEKVSIKSAVIDNLTTESATNALSANQGKILKDMANANTEAIASLNTTVTNLGSLAIESKTSGSTLDQISSYLVDNLETLTPVKGRFYQYMILFTSSPSGYVHLQIGSRETGVGYGYAYSMDYVTLYYFTISGGTCYLRKVANA